MKRGLMHVDLPPPWSSICTSLSEVEYEVEPDEDEDEDEEEEEEEDDEDDEDASGAMLSVVVASVDMFYFFGTR